MELRNIQTFLRIVELKQFTRAAEDLGYAQSTVTAQIHQMEEELGTPLFDRINNRVVLTDYGRNFLPLAKEMYNLNEEMHSLKTTPENMAGNLTIGVIESCIYSSFLDVISRYRRNFPKVGLTILTASSGDLCTMLAENRVDLILCVKTSADLSRFEITSTDRQEVSLFVGSGHPLLQKKEVTLEEASRYPFILTEDVSVYHQLLFRIFRKRGITPRNSITMQSTYAIKKLLRELPASIAFLPEYSVSGEVRRGELFKVPCEDLTVRISIISALYKGKWHSPQVQEMVKMIRESIPAE